MADRILPILTVLFVLLILELRAEIRVEEANLVELHRDTFYKVAHKLDKHVIIELYSSESWCSKYKI